MILAVDVHYEGSTAIVAGIAFNSWLDSKPEISYKSSVKDVLEYNSGAFYKREMPCILALLEEHKLVPNTIVIDGHVYLDDSKKPGLGKYLYDHFQGSLNVVGVAKKGFIGLGDDHKVLRGNSQKPLYITSAGLDLLKVKRDIINMHGEYRIPTILKLADSMCRGKS